MCTALKEKEARDGGVPVAQPSELVFFFTMEFEL